MDELKKIISEYAEVDPNKITFDMSIAGDIGLDSFALISLITEIEQTFEVSISDYELSNFQTLQDMADYLKKNSPVYKE